MEGKYMAKDLTDFMKESQQKDTSQQAQQAAMPRSNATHHRDTPSQEAVNQQIRETMKAKESQIQILQQQLNSVKAENKQMKDHLNAEESQKAEKAVSDIIQEPVETFKKTYTFPVAKGSTKTEETFDIELKPMTVEMWSQAEAQVAQITGGTFVSLPEASATAYLAVCVFRVAGVKVPDQLLDMSKMYRLDIPIMIYNDYYDWLQSFCSQVQY